MDNNKCIVNCFIRKNTEKLRKELIKLGYKQVENGVAEWHIPITELSYIETGYSKNNGNYFMGVNGYWYKGIVNCEDNEVLFLALAALREDNDYMQWFTDGVHWEIYPLQGTITQDMINKWKVRYAELNHTYIPHKATIGEIVKHFKST